MSQRRCSEKQKKKRIFTSVDGCNPSEESLYKNELKSLGNKK
jgi:hypothetical protein